MGARRVVSHYELLAPLGKGGMGEVYVALDTILQRKVALKAIRSDRRLDDEARARLLREARILSHLDHPNICRVYDFVEEIGEAWVVLELIEGRSLREALNDDLPATLNMRVAEQIAAALVVAHAAGIVHRDLKPENVMLLPDGSVKVLDFGLARSYDTRLPSAAGHAAAPPLAGSLLDTMAETMPGPRPEHEIDATAALTVAGALMGTPMYMSPEQAEGAPATTASDMYSFGLVLQELYTRRKPHDAHADPATLLRRIQAADVPAPVGLSRDLTELLRRLKSPAPSQRPTAVDTVDRLRAIREKPRKRLEYAAAIAALLIAAGGGIKYTIDVTRERTAALAAREEANQRRGQAEALIGFMLGDLRSKLQRVGRLDILDDVGQRAMGYFASVPEASMSNEELFQRAQAVHQIGQVQQARGNMKEATAAYAESLKLAGSLASRDPNNGEWQIGLATSHFYAGDALRLQGDFDGAMRHYGAYRDIAKALVDREPDNPTYLLELSYGHSNVAAALEGKGDLAGARGELEASQALKERLAAAAPADAEKQEAVARGHYRLGIVLEQLGETEAALERYQADLTIRDKLLAVDTNNMEFQRELADAASMVGLLQRDFGNMPEALKYFGLRQRLTAALVAREPENVQWQREHAIAEINIGTMFRAAGDLSGALRQIAPAAEVLHTLLRRSPTLFGLQFDVAAAEIELAQTNLQAGRVDAARTQAAAAVDRLASLAQRRTADADVHHFLAQAHLIVAAASRRLGEDARARESTDAAFQALRDIATRSRERRLQQTWQQVLAARQGGSPRK